MVFSMLGVERWRAGSEIVRRVDKLSPDVEVVEALGEIRLEQNRARIVVASLPPHDWRLSLRFPVLILRRSSHVLLLLEPSRVLEPKGSFETLRLNLCDDVGEDQATWVPNRFEDLVVPEEPSDLELLNGLASGGAQRA